MIAIHLDHFQIFGLVKFFVLSMLMFVINQTSELDKRALPLFDQGYVM